MSLSEGDLQYIGQYVRAELPGWLRDSGAVGVRQPAHGAHGARGGGTEGVARVAARPHGGERPRFEDIDRRFDDVNKRFDDVNKRFEDVNRRFDDNNRRHSTTQWFVGAGFLVVTTLISLYQFLG